MTREEEIVRRTQVALEALRESLGTEEGEMGADLFVTHHLEELAVSYWQQQLETETPTPEQVINLLVLKSHWSAEDEDGIDTFDFTLPGDATDYVLSVGFDESGRVESIAMES